MCFPKFLLKASPMFTLLSHAYIRTESEMCQKTSRKYIDILPVLDIPTCVCL